MVISPVIDGRIIALNKTDGTQGLGSAGCRSGQGEVITGAPLIVKDMVVTGMAGAEFGVRGWLEALDLKTGKRRWRTYTIPAPGEPGHETWKDKLRRLEDRRRHHLGHRLLRSRAQPDRLGHRQPGSGLGQRLPSWRQPVDRLARSRSMPTPARSSGASSTRRTIRTTTTRSRRTPSSIRNVNGKFVRATLHANRNGYRLCAGSQDRRVAVVHAVRRTS